MAKNHELDPSSSTFGDCSNCELAGELMAYLDYKSATDATLDESDERLSGDFGLTVEKRRILRRILEISPDLEAFSNEMKNMGICPLARLRTEHAEVVAVLVPLGACASFDLAHRPGVQLDRE